MGPLHGLRVLELGGIGPGPFCGMLLADLGADVVRVDRPGGPPAGLPAPDQDLLHRGKRSVAVDLKDAAGAAAVRGLAGRADALIEGFRPGVAERLGLGPADCHAINPRLVYGRMTGWGQDGPLAGRAGHDITYLAVTGVLHAIGPAGGPPQIPLNLLGDFAGGALYLAVGLLAALREATATGRGQVVDAGIVDGVAHLSTMVHGMLAAGQWRDERGVNLLDGGRPFYDVYATRDGGHVAVGPLEPRFFAELLARLDLDGLRQDDPAIRARLAAVFATRTRDEWSAVFAGSDACVAPVLSLAEAPDHPHLAARNTFPIHHGVRQPAPAPRFSGTPASLGAPPPRPGEHHRVVFADWGVAPPTD
ncbi:CaiB/BaiF CoA transferase family protein [Jidongwangia harbinensis]|uniref:CaiB/BaiF CoA transferase family protein n=1 Tax=Jidongwangia harbinensis TaxID=2878561 RepID=UPI001CD935FB|nr:CaiB/BaiF CoA-transferase family protein [Jidongwangia harbinensis]MCA2216238.1 CoA transferase [Jidongwangia harbinensis]